MKPSVFRTLIILATLSLIGIVVIQVYWVDKAFKIQQSQYVLQQKNYSDQEKMFNNRVTIALTNVAEEILDIYNDPSEITNAVEQLQSNFFVVRLNDTLHPDLLESRLKREFSKNGIKEDFEFAIYDCFTDSLVYGRFVSVDSSQQNDRSKHPDIKWEKEGHYFSVFFPNRESFTTNQPQYSIGAWFYTTIIIVIVFGFFGYSIFVILRQKRLADIKNDFINNMTHELKTPISTISLSSEVLLKEDICKDPQRVNQYARIIFNENKRLENQVERVLQLATLDKEEIALKKSEVDMHELITSCSSNFKLAVESVGGEIVLNLNAEKAIVYGDKIHLTNIIYNLIDNARKYSEGNPRIEVSTKSDKNNLCISVKDNGIGISKENMKHVFEKFYRVPTGNVHNVKGFGLGLYYVKVMTEQHGGKIEIESELQKGSTFTIKLPFQSK